MTSPQDLDSPVTNPTALDAIYNKVDKIARLQHVHGKRLDDASRRHLDFSVRLNHIERALDRINSSLDLVEDTQNAHGERLDVIVSLLRKEQVP